MGVIKNLTIGAWLLLTYFPDKYILNTDKRKEQKRLKEYIAEDDYLPIREQAVNQIITRLKSTKGISKKTCELIDDIEEELRAVGVTPREKDLVSELSKEISLSYIKDDITKLENIITKIRETKERIKEKRDFLSSPYKDTKVTFTNIDKKSEHKTLEMQEDTMYAEVGTPDYDKEPDRLFHGVVTIKSFDPSEDKILYTKDVYFYQPRLNYVIKTPTGTHSTFVGPKFLKNGTMNLKAPYCFNSNNKLFYGSLPKREILSNKVFDFDLSNEKSFNETVSSLLNSETETVNPDDVKRFISVKFDTDNKGFLKPIPISQEREVLRNYKKGNNHVDVDDVVSTLKTQLHKLSEYQEQQEIKSRAREESNRQVQERAEEASKEQASDKARYQEEAARLAAENAEIINRRLTSGEQIPALQGLSPEARAAEGYRVTGGRPMFGRPPHGPHR